MSDRIVVVCEDIFFWARILAAAEALGRVAIRVDDEPAMERAFEDGGARRIVMDLGIRSVDPLGWAARWKQREDAPRIVGFVSHVEAQMQERAKQAGFDEVLTKSHFSRVLPDLL